MYRLTVSFIEISSNLVNLAFLLASQECQQAGCF
jgi:hypothetical protein